MSSTPNDPARQDADDFLPTWDVPMAIPVTTPVSGDIPMALPVATPAHAPAVQAGPIACPACT
ncbi:MAG: hypothetical protein ACRC33_20825, partial [Gemmataceae bacterium]